MNFLTHIVNKKNKGKYVMSLDVGTKVAKALVSYVDFEKGEVVNIGVGKAEQKTGDIVGGKIVNVKGVARTCRAAVEEAKNKAGVKVEDIIMGLSGNTIKIRTDYFEVAREDSKEKINANELKSVIKDVYLRAFNKIQGDFTYRQRQMGMSLASADIVDLSIDGYRVMNPLNFKGEKIRVGISSSYIMTSDFEIINDIAKEVGMKLIKIAYGPYAVIKAIGAQNTLNFNAIVVDVGANITDVLIVKNGNILKAGMFILGGQLFTKRIAAKLGVSEEIAENIKIKYSKGRLVEEEKERIENVLAEDIELWFSGVSLILEEEAVDSVIPSNFLFYGGGSQLPGLVASINNFKKTNLPFTDNLKLSFIELNSIAGNLDKAGGLDGFQDLTLAGLAHLCLDWIDTEDTANKFLAEIILKNKQ